MSPCYVVTTLYKMQFASIQTKVCSNLLIWFVLLAKVRLLNKVTSLSSKTYQISAKSTFLILFGSIGITDTDDISTSPSCIGCFCVLILGPIKHSWWFIIYWSSLHNQQNTFSAVSALSTSDRPGHCKWDRLWLKGGWIIWWHPPTHIQHLYWDPLWADGPPCPARSRRAPSCPSSRWPPPRR